MYRMLTRVYSENKISTGDFIFKNKDKVHHISKVLRLKGGDDLLIFNQESGEFFASIKAIKKSEITLDVKKFIRKKSEKRSVTIAFSPIKPDRVRFLIEKCTEIGCTKFMPVITDRTIIKKVNEEKIYSYIIGASEQSCRVSLPEIQQPTSLKALVAENREKMLFCDERENTQSISQVKIDGDITILTGPEGGFSDEERKMLHLNQYTSPVTLGENILRAETAAIVALSHVVKV
jgi:16S rRNA (uracil1498-N3)-methyltransferase